MEKLFWLDRYLIKIDCYMNTPANWRIPLIVLAGIVIINGLIMLLKHFGG